MRRRCIRPIMKPVASNNAIAAIAANAITTSLVVAGWIGRGLAGLAICGTPAEVDNSITAFDTFETTKQLLCQTPALPK